MSDHGVRHGSIATVAAGAPAAGDVAKCGSELTFTAGEVDTGEYRALVTPGGDTVVECRGTTTVDITRASDGAMLDEVDLSGRGFETYSADRTTAPGDRGGFSVFVAVDPLEKAAFAEAWLPGEFLFLDGRFTATITYQSEGEKAVMVSAVITEHPTDYVFDLCALLDRDGADR